jgi:hypothetical protein
MNTSEFGENSAGKETIRLDRHITASGMPWQPWSMDDWYDCRELLPLRDANVHPEKDQTSVWCIVVSLDNGIYLAYYNYTQSAWFECTPDWRSFDLEDEYTYPFYKIAAPYKWRYLPTLPQLPVIQEDR